MTTLNQDISEYVICRVDCPLRYLEALAMNGLATKAVVEDCDKKNFKKIALTLVNGEKITSTCEFFEEVEQSLRIINVYISLSKRRKSETTP